MKKLGPRYVVVTLGSKTEPYYESEKEMMNTSSYLLEELSEKELKHYNLMENLEHKDNPHYQNGYFWGDRLAPMIENSMYKTLEEAIRVKEELIKDFEEHFKWDMDNRDYAEAVGFRDAMKAALSNQQSNEQDTDSTGSPG